MDSQSLQGLDILVYPAFRHSTDDLLEILSEADVKKVDAKALTSAAKKWLSEYNAAKVFIYDAPFVYPNMYLAAIRKANEKGELSEELLKEAFNLWITALDSFQKSYNSGDT